MRFFSERMASFGWTVLDRMTSDISRFRAMFSLQTDVSGCPETDLGTVDRGSYKLLLVAFSICSSRAVLAPEDHQPIMVDSLPAEQPRAGLFEAAALEGADLGGGEWSTITAADDLRPEQPGMRR